MNSEKKAAKENKVQGEKPLEKPTDSAAKVAEIKSRPRRHPAIHWAALVFSLVSLGILIAWLAGPRGVVPTAMVVLDIVLAAFSAFDFFTRSGFRWEKGKYARSRFYDFIAMVPVLALVHHGFPLEGVWVWIILAARALRAIDRILGDGFIARNVLALVDGIEEELTDRVLLKILARVQEDMDRANFSQGVAEAFSRNKSSILKRISAATPSEGIGPGIARAVGLDKAIERGEEKVYDAIVDVLKSSELNKAVRDVLNSTFTRIREQTAQKTWRKNLGFRRQPAVAKSSK